MMKRLWFETLLFSIFEPIITLTNTVTLSPGFNGIRKYKHCNHHNRNTNGIDYAKGETTIVEIPDEKCKIKYKHTNQTRSE
jgi:hypothetical protein